MKRLTTLIARYVAHDDPLAAAANVVALAIGLNQPFYPLTLYLATGADVTWAFIDFVSGPCFLAIPAIMRRHSLGGRVALVVVGSLDTFISVKIFGQVSGAEFYVIPCLLMAALLFRKHEVRWSYGLIVLTFAGLLGMHDRYGVDFLQWPARDYETLVRINAVSVAMLTTFVAVCLGRARGDG